MATYQYSERKGHGRLILFANGCADRMPCSFAASPTLYLYLCYLQRLRSFDYARLRLGADCKDEVVISLGFGEETSGWC